MTVDQLIDALKRYPKDTEVRLVYDSQVMCVAVKAVGRWNDSWDEDKQRIVIGLFDDKAPADDDRWLEVKP